MSLRNRASTGAAWLVLGTLALPASAQELAEEGFFGDLPVVLSAARIAQTTVESPVSFSVLDEEAIRAIGARDVAELFRQLPGFQVGYFVGNKPVVTYHGLADQYARRMQVLIDGRSVYVPIYGGVPWENLPLVLDDIVRIEVVRGPNAASFGPNSFAGVISISTRHATENAGALVSVAAGDREWRSGVVRLSGEPDDLDYRLSLGYEEHEGFDDVNDSRRARQLTTRVDFSMNATDTLMFQAGVNAARNGIGEESDIGDPDRAQQPINHFRHLRWERNLSADEAWVVQYYFNHYELIDGFGIDTQIEVPPFPPVSATTDVDFDAVSERHDLEAQYNVSPLEGLRLVTGASVRTDEVTSEGFFGTDETLSNDVARVFGHAEWTLAERWIANVGAMWEDNDISGEDTSPKVGLLYKLDTHQSLRAGVSQATRTPVFIETRANTRFPIATDAPAPFDMLLDQTLLGGGELDPERIRSVELGYRLGGPDFDLDVRLFRDEIEDIISQIPVAFADDSFDGEASTFVNRGTAEVVGIEAQIDTEPSPRLRLLGALSYTESDVDDDDAEGSIERSIPRWTANLLGIVRLSGSSFMSFDYNYVEDIDWLDKRRRHAATIRRLDLQYSRSLEIGGQNANFALNLENVLGDYTDYQEDNVVEPGAYARFSVNYR